MPKKSYLSQYLQQPVSKGLAPAHDSMNPGAPSVSRLEEVQRYNQDYLKRYVPAQIKAAPAPKSVVAKAWDVLTNPVTAAQQYAEKGYLPGNFNLGDRNSLDFATDVINPAAWGNYAYHGAKNLPGDIEYGIKSDGNFLPAAMDVASLLPAATAAKGLWPYVKGYKEVNPIVKASLLDGLKAVSANYNPNNLKIREKAQDWIQQWYNDPITRSKMDHWNDGSSMSKLYHPKLADMYTSISADGTIEDITNQVRRDYKSELFREPTPELLKTKNYSDLLKEQGWDEFKNKKSTTSGISYGKPGEIYINNTPFLPFNRIGKESTKVHELTHLMEGNGTFFNDTENAVLQEPFKDAPKSKRSAYYTKPTEIHARMNEARYMLGLKPEDTFTPAHYDQIMKKNNLFGMGKYITDKDAMTRLMNRFYTGVGTGIGIGTVATGSENNEYKDGGKINMKKTKKFGGKMKYCDDGFRFDRQPKPVPPGSFNPYNFQDNTMGAMPDIGTSIPAGGGAPGIAGMAGAFGQAAGQVVSGALAAMPLISKLLPEYRNHSADQAIPQAYDYNPNGDRDSILFEDGGSIHLNPANKGKFSAAAERAGMGVQEYAHHVMAHSDNPTLRKRAQFAINATKFRHADGGKLDSNQYNIYDSGKHSGKIWVKYEFPKNLPPYEPQQPTMPQVSGTGAPNHRISYEMVGKGSPYQGYVPKFSGYSKGEIRRMQSSIPDKIGNLPVYRGDNYYDFQDKEPITTSNRPVQMPYQQGDSLYMDLPEYNTHYQAYLPDRLAYSYRDGGRLQPGQQVNLTHAEIERLRTLGYQIK